MHKKWTLLLFIISLLLDQWSKGAILDAAFNPQNPVMELTPFFNLVLVWNKGVSFGLFASQNQPVVLTVISAIIVIILLIWMIKNESKLIAIALGLVIGGAVGNSIDRLRFGAVTDFLDFHLGTYHWPAFNIADSCIFIGVVLLCISSMFTPTTNTHKEITS